MDICSAHGMLISEDVNSFHELTPFSVAPPQSGCCVTEDVSVNELENSLKECLHIQDNQELESSSIPPFDENGSSNVEKEVICEELHHCKSSTSEKCFCKCATFPCSGKTASLTASMDAEDEHDDREDGEGKDEMTSAVSVQSGCIKSANPPYSRSISLPTPLKLVSAMKGSHEKQGRLPKKLTVTWAPDVYDPPPSAASHVATPKTHRHRSDHKRNGKNKQKGGGKPSRGSRGKDKKQVQKYGGKSNKCFKPLEHEKLVDRDEPCAGLVDFEVSSPDSYCGSSFLKKSVSRLHYSVAEAT